MLYGNMEITLDEDSLSNYDSKSRSQGKDGQIWLCKNKEVYACPKHRK